jgi:superfamily II DNA or RNA helicase
MALKVTLRNYQRAAVKKALAAYRAKHRGFLIGDKMGLGKTVEALAIADEMPKTHKLIAVVAPAFLCPKWTREIKEKTGPRDYKYIVASYTQLTKPRELFAFTNRKYDLIIFDEVHYLKAFDSLRTRAAFGGPSDNHRTAISVATRLLGLSGTWPPNNVGDCHTWFRATDHELGRMTFTEFVFKFAEWAQVTQYGLRHKGIKNFEEFAAAFAPVYIGRNIDDVTDEIPAGRREFEILETPKDLAKEEKAIFADLLTHAGHSKDEADAIVNFDEYFERLVSTTPDFARLAEFRKRQGFVKINAVCEFITDNVWPEQKKILLFCYHKEVAEKYTLELKKAKLPVVIVHGGNTSATEREQVLHAADAADECILICTIDAVREGFDLVGFSFSVFAEIDWRPWALDQAEGRTRRIGQKKNVAWHYFVFDSGVDESMRARLSEKTETIERIRGVT